MAHMIKRINIDDQIPDDHFH